MSNDSPRLDVRMRGFSRRAEVETVLKWIDQHALRVAEEVVSIEQAAGRILATDVVAPADVPEFDRAAMDGYAVRGAETTGASEYNPLVLQVVGQTLPGQPFRGPVPPGKAIRIMTGAPVPEGTDAIVPAEYAHETANDVEIALAVAPGKHIGRCGEDIKNGSSVLLSGRQLRPQDIGLLASLGIAQITVIRRPRVRIVITGNEVIAPGNPKGPYQIYDANSAMLYGLIARDGGPARASSIRATHS